VNDSFFEISRQINPLWIARYHQRCESKVASRAKFCVCISPKIREEISVYNKNIVDIPLGSPDIDQFNIKIADVPSVNKPIQVVLVAVIKKLNISHNVLNSLLEDETLRVTLVGPIEEGFLDQIPQRDKLVCKGAMYGKALYEEINKYDVAIAPYCTETRNDIFTGTGGKIYHYLSMGKPVVITRMEGLKDLKLNDRMIYPAGLPGDFPALVHKAHEENSTALIHQRIEWARGNTWNRRMEDLVSYYQSDN
jgi:glycosyltransferase involved in cell wall biosynthesis